MTTPFASVLIDTYNHERFIEEAIQSVLSQDFPAADREIIVVDDGSTDRTPEILRKFAPQIRILRKPNGGQASAFNHAIPECKGELIAFLDADDWWAPGKLTRVANVMAAEPSLGFLGHGIITVLPDGSQRTEVLRDGFCFQANELSGALLFRRRCAFMGTSRMTLRRNLLQRIGPIPTKIRIQADEYIYTLASVLTPIRILPEALTCYRVHADNGFHIWNPDPQKLRNKQEALATLAETLSLRLAELGINSEVRRALLDYTQASADQLRLSLDGGWSWETAAAEWKVYRVTHPSAPVAHQFFKSLTLLTALFVPPKKYYRTQKALAQSHWYRRLRGKWLPFPEMEHIQMDDHARDGSSR
ncbi:MAG TPA: glycosyltransferase [Candidatus Sulfotelmatobacter sp.]|jgi:glycosyltransferase involved in cell wall biosynthesis|nr:glycosyltransferase [Candidatus Sulfotelmatobacter sp.]